MSQTGMAERIADPREPTPEECDTIAPIELPDGRTGRAVWTDSIGKPAKAISCDYDFWLWHNGRFPYRHEHNPALIHFRRPAGRPALNQPKPPVDVDWIRTEPVGNSGLCLGVCLAIAGLSVAALVALAASW